MIENEGYEYVDICPNCGSQIITFNWHDYCEGCGWPDADYSNDDQPTLHELDEAGGEE